MPKSVITDASLVVNSVDLSNHVISIDVPSEADAVDSTAMGQTTKTTMPGLFGSTITATLFQDFAAGSVDATIWPLHQNKTTFTLVFKPTSAAVGATNPSYTCTAWVSKYQVIAGSVGERATAQVTFEIASGSLTRAVA